MPALPTMTRAALDGLKWELAFALAAILLLVLQFPVAAQTQTQTPGPPAQARRSGLEFMGPALQAMQRDDAQNPGMLWVKEGAALWSKPAGRSNQSCASCHGEAAGSMLGVRRATRNGTPPAASRSTWARRSASAASSASRARPWRLRARSA